MSREADLQNLLSNERMRCEQHMVNYQTLKDEYNRLQVELISVHDQLKQAVEDSSKRKELNDKYIVKLQESILEKEKEIDILKDKIAAYNPEEIKKILLEEAERSYQETAEHLEAEIDSYREQYNRLHYEHAVLKCQFQYLETEQSRTLEEMKLRHVAEIEQLKEATEGLIVKQSSSHEDNTVQLRVAHREMMLLNTKLKIALSECEELRTQKEKIALQMDSMARNHSKRLAESIANIRTIESEKSKIAMQNDCIQKELSVCLDHKRRLSNELQAANAEVLNLQSQLEDCEHRYQLKTGNLQMEIIRQKGENQAEKESFLEELRKSKLEKDILEAELGNLKQSAVEKEQNFQLQLQSASEQVMKKYNDLDYEKNKIERKLKEAEISKLEAISELHRELESTKQKLQHVLEENAVNEKQVFVLKTKLDSLSKRNDELLYDDLVKHNAALRSEVNNLREKIELLSTHNQELLEQSEKHVTENLAHRKSEIVRKEAESVENFNQRLTMEQQKFELLQRISELEMQLKEKHKDAESEKRELQNKLKLNTKLIQKLHHKLGILQTREEELEVATELLKKNVPVEVHSRVKKELLELQRKQEEFHQIMVTAARYAPPHSNVDTALSSLKISDRKVPFTPLPSEMTVNIETSGELQSGTSKHVPSKTFPTRRRQRRRLSKNIKPAVHFYSSSSDLENLSLILDNIPSSID